MSPETFAVDKKTSCVKSIPMFQLLHVETSTVFQERFSTEAEAKTEAVKHLKEFLGKTPEGRRLLEWMGTKPITWDIARKYFVISEALGVWIETNHGNDLPEASTDEGECVFIVRGGQRHLGNFDDDRGVFYSQIDNAPYLASQVLAWMILPESKHD